MGMEGVGVCKLFGGDVGTCTDEYDCSLSKGCCGGTGTAFWLE